MSNEPDAGEQKQENEAGRSGSGSVLEKWVGHACVLLAGGLYYILADDPRVSDLLVRMMIIGYTIYSILQSHFPKEGGAILWSQRLARFLQPVRLVILQLSVGIIIGIGVYHSIHMVDFTGGEMSINFPEESGLFFLVMFLVIVSYVAMGRDAFKKHLTKRPPPAPISRGSRAVQLHRARLIVGVAIILNGIFLTTPVVIALAFFAYLVGGYRLPKLAAS